MHRPYSLLHFLDPDLLEVDHESIWRFNQEIIIQSMVLLCDNERNVERKKGLRFFVQEVCMKVVYHLGLLVFLLTFTFSATSAATAACKSQPTNPDGWTITSPAPGAAVTSPFTIKGMVPGVFEGIVPIRILDASGNVLIDAGTNTGQCCIPVPYESTVTFSVSAPTPACIVVYRYDASGLTGDIPQVQIPVILSPAGILPDTGSSSILLPLLSLALALVGIGMLLRRMLPFWGRNA
jgi:LPXTG-motif cell wall-anchored protein